MCLYVFNFHVEKSFEGYEIGTNWSSKHMVLYETDEERFGGNQRLNEAHNNLFEPSKPGV